MSGIHVFLQNQIKVDGQHKADHDAEQHHPAAIPL